MTRELRDILQDPKYDTGTKQKWLQASIARNEIPKNEIPAYQNLVTPPQQAGFFDSVGEGFKEAASADAYDSPQAGNLNPIGNTIGRFAGGATDVLAGTAAGAATGTIIGGPGVGTAIGGIAGGITTAAGLGGARELDRQQDLGQPISPWPIAGEALIQGGLQAIPFSKAANLGVRLGRNALAQGGLSVVGDAATQGLESFANQKPFEYDPQRGLNAGALGAAGGSVASFAGQRKPAEAPRPLPTLEPVPAGPRQVEVLGQPSSRVIVNPIVEDQGMYPTSAQQPEQMQPYVYNGKYIEPDIVGHVTNDEPPIDADFRDTFPPALPPGSPQPWDMPNALGGQEFPQLPGQTAPGYPQMAQTAQAEQQATMGLFQALSQFPQMPPDQQMAMLGQMARMRQQIVAPSPITDAVDALLQNNATMMEGAGQSAPPKPKINPATGRPIPRGAAPGFIAIPSPGQQFQRIKGWMREMGFLQGFPKKPLAPDMVAYAFQHLSNSLPEDTQAKFFQADDTRAAMTAKYIGPLDKLLGTVEYVPSADDAKLFKLDAEHTVSDIVAGRVDVRQYGLDPKWQPIVQMAAQISNDLPDEIGMLKSDVYEIRKRQTMQPEDTLYFDADGNIVVHPIGDQYLNILSTIDKSRTNTQGELDASRAYMAQKIGHFKALITQHSVAPFELASTPEELAAGKKKYKLLPGHLQQALEANAADEALPFFQREAAARVKDLITGAAFQHDFLNRVVNKAHQNFIENALANNIWSAIKAAPDILRVDAPMGDVTAAVNAQMHDPDMKDLLHQAHLDDTLTTFMDTHAPLDANIMQRQGKNFYLEWEKYLRRVTYAAFVVKQSRERGVPLSEIRAGKTPAAKMIRAAAIQQVQNSQGSVSPWSRIPIQSIGPLRGWATLKGSQFAEYRWLLSQAKKTVQGDKQAGLQLGRFLAAKITLGGVRFFIDPKAADLALLTGLASVPGIGTLLLMSQAGGPSLTKAMEDQTGIEFTRMNSPLISLDPSRSDPLSADGISALLDSEDPEQQALWAANTINMVANFLPIARLTGKITGVQISPGMVKRGVDAVQGMMDPDGQKLVAGKSVPRDPVRDVIRTVLPGNPLETKIRSQKLEKIGLQNAAEQAIEVDENGDPQIQNDPLFEKRLNDYINRHSYLFDPGVAFEDRKAKVLKDLSDQRKGTKRINEMLGAMYQARQSSKKQDRMEAAKWERIVNEKLDEFQMLNPDWTRDEIIDHYETLYSKRYAVPDVGDSAEREDVVGTR